MKLSLAGLLGLFSCAAATVQTTLTLSIPTTSNLNPQTLPPQTHATLSTLHATHAAALSPHNTFTFRNLTGPASYLLRRARPSQGKGILHPAARLRSSAVGVKGYFVERSKFSIVNIVMKNPMILMGMVTMGIFLGMPYMLKNSAYLSFHCPSLPPRDPSAGQFAVCRRVREKGRLLGKDQIARQHQAARMY
ncbi:predicted protein [Verticillium alfalfae VaMs.102]|uniref:Predicted protein n=1 Tax=Verticillium alfalfae (strain VaMs.102 / ATCC MYA-4576 / FGSC 10136) TaxID=526221 RepID=C9SCV1_VERA1|nr:predicted protein [Verticillium alfalfae VaMs.102]EEY16916.1 predicted protein [Verticillium alfalfae VaMs.102]